MVQICSSLRPDETGSIERNGSWWRHAANHRVATPSGPLCSVSGSMADGSIESQQPAEPAAILPFDDVSYPAGPMKRPLAVRDSSTGHAAGSGRDFFSQTREDLKDADTDARFDDHKFESLHAANPRDHVGTGAADYHSGDLIHDNDHSSGQHRSQAQHNNDALDSGSNKGASVDANSTRSYDHRLVPDDSDLGSKVDGTAEELKSNDSFSDDWRETTQRHLSGAETKDAGSVRANRSTRDSLNHNARRWSYEPESSKVSCQDRDDDLDDHPDWNYLDEPDDDDTEQRRESYDPPGVLNSPLLQEANRVLRVSSSLTQVHPINDDHGDRVVDKTANGEPPSDAGSVANVKVQPPPPALGAPASPPERSERSVSHRRRSSVVMAAEALGKAKSAFSRTKHLPGILHSVSADTSIPSSLPNPHAMTTIHADADLLNAVATG